jgi:hypothetical protein
VVGLSAGKRQRVGDGQVGRCRQAKSAGEQAETEAAGRECIGEHQDRSRDDHAVEHQVRQRNEGGKARMAGAHEGAF